MFVQGVIVEDHIFVAEVAGVEDQLDDLLLWGPVEFPVLRHALLVLTSYVLPQEREVERLVTSATEGLDTVGQGVTVELGLHHLGLLDDERLGSFPRSPLPADDDLVGELLSKEIAHVDGLLDWEGLVCSTWQHFLLYQRPQGLKQVKADPCGGLTVSCFTWEVDSVILPAFAQQQMALTSL